MMEPAAVGNGNPQPGPNSQEWRAYFRAVQGIEQGGQRAGQPVGRHGAGARGQNSNQLICLHANPPDTCRQGLQAPVHTTLTADAESPVRRAVSTTDKLSALALLGMTLVIQVFVYPDAWPTHLSWAALLWYLVGRSGSARSLDRALVQARGGPGPEVVAPAAQAVRRSVSWRWENLVKKAIGA